MLAATMMTQSRAMPSNSAPSIPAVGSPAARDGDAARASFGRRDTSSVASLMTQLLDHTRPGSDAEALRLLRQAFPAAPLAARVEAMARRTR